MAPKNEFLSSISRQSYNLDNRQPPFGNVLVCIGSDGLPGDVTAVSISKLARQYNWMESRVIDELQKGGCLLFDEKTFSLLIDKLIEDVRSGQLRLPISRERLAEIAASCKLNPEAPDRQ